MTQQKTNKTNIGFVRSSATTKVENKIIFKELNHMEMNGELKFLSRFLPRDGENATDTIARLKYHQFVRGVSKRHNLSEKVVITRIIQLLLTEIDSELIKKLHEMEEELSFS